MRRVKGISEETTFLNQIRKREKKKKTIHLLIIEAGVFTSHLDVFRIPKRLMRSIPDGRGAEEEKKKEKREKNRSRSLVVFIGDDQTDFDEYCKSIRSAMFMSSIRNIKQYAADSAYSIITAVSVVSLTVSCGEGQRREKYVDGER